MRKISRSITIIILSIFLIAILLIVQHQLAITHPLPTIKISKQQTAINYNDNLIDIFSLGFKRLFSAIIWIETLMESDLEHYEKNDLGSWMFLRFSTLNRIDPNFYEVYRFGGQYLSIVKDDDMGAAEIYERGLKLFPDDFWLNFHAAFHYYFEMGNAERAIELYKKIAFTKMAKEHIPYLPSLLARLMIKQKGVTEDIYKLVLAMFHQLKKESNLKKRIHQTLYSIRAELDLKCLNSKINSSCNKVDFDGLPYLYDKLIEKYKAQTNWASFKINIPN